MSETRFRGINCLMIYNSFGRPDERSAREPNGPFSVSTTSAYGGREVPGGGAAGSGSREGA